MCDVLDFGMSPPEVTSAKIYAGPGSGPLLAAAASYDALAAQLNTFAAGYFSVIADLQGESWTGRASAAMAAAATRYAEWAAATAGRSNAPPVRPARRRPPMRTPV
ncbi:hypothetical protein MALGJ_12290 [Mycolicibacter algericus]|uniref:PPE domain-containing protein n=1 Tax=Mycolicibacter algericus TaxID=1288388 RepID=A0A7I9Y7V4_MYCAL|nr:hypothetical protein MALGJ_12290 [Mycolicibacter algericus]